MRTSLTVTALGVSAALPVALALLHAPAGAHAAAVPGLAKRAGMQRRVRRQDIVALLAVDADKSSSSSAQSAVYESTAIWWAEDGWTGTCGETISDDALVAGLPLAVYPDVSAASPLCGTTVSVTAPSTGRHITATVVGASDRDDYTTFSKAAFLALGGDLDTGMLAVELSLGDAAAAEAVHSASVSKASVASTASHHASSSAAGLLTMEHGRPTTTRLPTTTALAPQTTKSSAWDLESYAASKSAVEAAAAASKSKAAAEWAASCTSFLRLSSPRQLSGIDSTSARLVLAASSAAAAASAASSSSAAAAAASKASADAAWASSSSAAAASSSKAAADAARASSLAAAVAEKTQTPSTGSDSGGDASGKVYTGGNCGDRNSDNAYLVALPTETYADGSHCGRNVRVTRTSTGKSIQAFVADSCPTCPNTASLDLSWGAFTALGGTEREGIFDITWQFVN
ncbi:hypothetical protein JCM3770_004350 [Rhodotorula araucariae]